MTALTEEAAERHIAEHSFATGAPGFVGAVVQLVATPLLPDGPAPAGPVFHRLRHGHLTGDLDGVVSVSTPPSPGLDVCLRRTAEDLAMARDLLARRGLAPGERALDPYRRPDELEATRPAAGTASATPYTAAVRICLDAGLDGPGPAGLSRRWAVAHAVGPVLTAAFANSPLRAGRPTGWRSTRQAMRSARGGVPTGADPRASWAAYALDAPFDAATAEHRDGSSFRQRLRGTHPPDLDDLRRHLQDLPAPVRARGHLELDMVDAQPGDGWAVALAVATVLVDDSRAADEAVVATGSLPADAWTRAARDGLRDSRLAEAARHCFVAAYAALARRGVDRQLRDAVAAYIQRYVNRSRSPADDLLDPVAART